MEKQQREERKQQKREREREREERQERKQQKREREREREERREERRREKMALKMIGADKMPKPSLEEQKSDKKSSEAQLDTLYARLGPGFKAWVTLFKELFVSKALAGIKIVWEGIRDSMPSLFGLFQKGYGAIEAASKGGGVKGYVAWAALLAINAGMSTVSMGKEILRAIATFPRKVYSGIKSLYESAKSNSVMVILLYAVTQAISYAKWMIDMYARDPKQTIRFLMVMQTLRDGLCKYAASYGYSSEETAQTWGDVISERAGNLAQGAEAMGTVHMREQMAPGGKLDGLMKKASGWGIKILSDGAKSLPGGGFISAVVDIVGDSATEAMRESAEIMLMVQEASTVQGMALRLIDPRTCFEVYSRSRAKYAAKADEVLQKIRAEEQQKAAAAA